ncbi:hypothetical protein HRG84_02385 [Flavisolibacter sp. BT320]|nr:hypothetical protein [Flavisolibacter longurius]
MLKNLLPFVLFVSLVVLAACNRKVATESNAAPLLTGTWELREDQRGMMPTRQHEPGSGTRYQFTQTDYEYFVEGALDKKGTYKVEADPTVEKEVGLQLPAGQFTHRIVFDDDTTATKTFFRVAGDTLVFLSGFFPVDGGSRFTYLKISGKE